MSPYLKAYEAGVKLAQVEHNQEKTAILTRLLKPISDGYAGRALADRIAPLGGRRILSELGHGLGDVATGAGVSAALGGGMDDMVIAGGLSGIIGKQFNQMRANKYLDKALKGSNALSKKELQYLRGQMGDINTILGAETLPEVLGGQSARKRVEDAIKRKLF